MMCPISQDSHTAQAPKTMAANQDTGKHHQTANEEPKTLRCARIWTLPAQDQRPDTWHTHT